jgi:hypothetical protein
MNSANYESNNEVSVAEIARTFGWTINVGKEDNILGGSKTLLGDEVYSPYWLRADTTKPVLLWSLAVYSGRNNNPHDSIRFEAKPGSGGKSGLIYELAGRNNDDSPTGNEVLGSNNLSGGENQKLLPKILVNNVNSVPTTNTVDFTPTSTFALNRGGAWTDDTKNGTSHRLPTHGTGKRHFPRADRARVLLFFPDLNFWLVVHNNTLAKLASNANKFPRQSQNKFYSCPSWAITAVG